MEVLRSRDVVCALHTVARKGAWSEVSREMRLIQTPVWRSEEGGSRLLAIQSARWGLQITWAMATFEAYSF